MRALVALVVVAACDRGPHVVIGVPEDLRGVGTAQIALHVTARGRVTATLAVDGTPLATLPGERCDGSCVLAWTWDTSGLAAGLHRLVATVDDDSDRHADSAREVVAGDVVYVRAIEVTHERDWPTPRLEIEAHVYDEAGAHLGCAGGRDGLAEVDRSDRRYAVVGVLRDDAGAPLDPVTLASQRLRMDVIEDDVHPCPAAPDPVRDDVLASFGPASLAELTAAPLKGGKVLDLEVAVGRPWVR